MRWFWLLALLAACANEPPPPLPEIPPPAGTPEPVASAPLPVGFEEVLERVAERRVRWERAGRPAEAGRLLDHAERLLHAGEFAGIDVFLDRVDDQLRPSPEPPPVVEPQAEPERPEPADTKGPPPPAERKAAVTAREEWEEIADGLTEKARTDAERAHDLLARAEALLERGEVEAARVAYSLAEREFRWALRRHGPR